MRDIDAPDGPDVTGYLQVLVTSILMVVLKWEFRERATEALRTGPAYLCMKLLERRDLLKAMAVVVIYSHSSRRPSASISGCPAS